jgi:RNA recognition motif-containing protein
LKSNSSVSHEINGHTVAVRRALAQNKASEITKELQKLKLFVKNLPLDATSNEIKKFFSKFGPVNRVQMTINSKSKEFKGFAYVIISNKKCYEKILKLFQENQKIKNFDEINPQVLFRGINLLQVESSLSLSEVTKNRRKLLLEQKEKESKMGFSPKNSEKCDYCLQIEDKLYNTSNHVKRMLQRLDDGSNSTGIYFQHCHRCSNTFHNAGTLQNNISQKENYFNPYDQMSWLNIANGDSTRA